MLNPKLVRSQLRMAATHMVLHLYMYTPVQVHDRARLFLCTPCTVLLVQYCVHLIEVTRPMTQTQNQACNSMTHIGNEQVKLVKL